MSDNSDSSFNCEYCNKDFKTKHNMLRHVNSCKVYIKINNENIKLKEEEEKQKILYENNKLKEEIERLKEENNKLKEEIKYSEYEFKIKMSNLETEIYKSQSQIQTENILEIAKQPTINNNTINNTYKNKIAVTFDLKDKITIEDIQTKVCNALNKVHFMNGQKGIARVVSGTILKNENGIDDKYLCSDQSRGSFRYKDSDGVMQIDHKAMRLTDIIYKGVKEKIQRISKECMDKETDTDLIVLISRNILDINKMNEDNTDFRNEIILLSK